MAYRCIICGKSTRSGRSYAHSNKSSLRKFKPNLHKHKILLNGKVTTEYICTKCLKANKVVKVA